MKVVAVVPARLASTRFPAKLLAPLAGHPLLWYPWNALTESSADDVVVVTDCDEIGRVVESWGGRALVDNRPCANGTERLAHVVEQLDAEAYVNLQGDEAEVTSDTVDRVIAELRGGAPLVTAVYPLAEPALIAGPDTVKVKRAESGTAVDFSRSGDVIRDNSWGEVYWGHVGIYGYSRDMLDLYRASPPSVGERRQDLEQLRFIDAGKQFDCVEVASRPRSVNRPDHLATLNASWQSALI